VSHSDEPVDVDAIAAALDRDDPETALDLAVDALRAADEPDAFLHYLAGRALLDLGRPDAAIGHLERSARIDPDDPDYAADFALALFRACRFDESLRRLDSPPLAADDDRADLRELRGLLLERRGRFDDADREFERAHALDPDGFPKPTRLARERFEDEVRRAAEQLPDSFRKHLDEVAVTVEDIPSTEILTDGDPPFDPAELLGLFVGTSLPELSHLGPGGELPPRILLFRRNLERYASDAEDLREQIAVTLYHELGHYLGMDEDDLARIDLA